MSKGVHYDSSVQWDSSVSGGDSKIPEDGSECQVIDCQSSINLQEDQSSDDEENQS